MTEQVRGVMCCFQSSKPDQEKAHGGSQQIGASITIRALVSGCLIGILARLVSSTTASLLASSPNSDRQLPSSERDFQLYTHIMAIATDSVDIDIRLTTFERYSGSLKKGRVDIRAHQTESQVSGSRMPGPLGSNQNLASYFYAENFGTNQLIKVINGHECHRVARLELAVDLFEAQNVPEISELNDLLNGGLPLTGGSMDGTQSGRHVFGASRFLVYFEQNRDKFKYISRPQQISLRNTEIDLFEHHYSVAPNHNSRLMEGQVLVKVFLPSSTSLDRSDSRGRLPLRVWLLFPSKVEVVIDFHAIKPIQLNQASIGMYEQFNLPAGLGCSHLIEKPADQADRLFVSETDRSDEICSFEFELVKMAPMGRGDSIPLQSSFVAYDGVAGALRVEPIAKGASTRTPGQRERTIYDLNAGFKFHLEVKNSIEQPNSDNTTGHQMPLGAKSTSTQSCRIARLVTTELLPADPVLPTAQMVEIGLGQVRGIPAIIYETTKGQLPWMIFEHGSWEDANRRQQTKFDPTDKGASDDYTLVYYVTTPTTTRTRDTTTTESAASKEQSRLLRLDVYRNSEHFYRAEVFNFDWRLSVAPNGNSHAQLFSVHDHCLQPESSQQELDLVLALVDKDEKGKFEESKSVSTIMTTTSGQETRRLVELLKRSATRHIDLIRGLSLATSSLSATRVMDVQFRVALEEDTSSEEKGSSSSNGLTNGYSAKLLASVRLMSGLQGSPLVRARFVGTGLQMGDARPIDNVFTFNDCFWRASKWARPKWIAFDPSSRNPQPATVFTFCYSRCWIDTRARLQRWPVIKSTQIELPQLESRVFMVAQLVGGKDLPCELLLVEEIESNSQDGLASFASKFEPIMAEEIRGQLENKLLTVHSLAGTTINPIGEPDNSNDNNNKTTSLTFKVERAEVKQDEANFETGLSVNGITFGTMASATHSAWQIKPSNSHDQLAKQSLTPETCHAMCVTNPVCKSYSICVRPDQQVECWGSSIDLRNKKFHAELESKLDEHRSQHQTSSGKIVMQDEQGGNLEIIVNKRCKVRAKRAIEMFREVDGVTKGSRLHLNGLSPASSRESCAEKCLETNIKYFARLSRAQKVIRGSRGLAEEKEEDTNDDEQRVITNRTDELHDQHLDTMRFWCDRYKYLDLRARPPGPVILKQVQQAQLFKRVDMTKIGGVCYMARGQWASKADLRGASNATKGNSKQSQQPEVPLITLTMDTFEFRYDLLYARQEGVRLLGVAKQAEGSRQEDVNLSGAARDDPVDSNEEVVSPFVNVQTKVAEHPANVDFCARQCFTQAVQWCRSFDLIQTTKTTSYCVYNSLTRDEALRATAGEQETNEQTSTDKSAEEKPPTGTSVHYYHFEPNDAYTLDIIILKMASAVTKQQEQQLEQEEEEEEQEQAAGDPPTDTSSDNNSSIWACLLGLVSGFALAVLIIGRWRNSGSNSVEYRPQLHTRVSLARLSFSLPTECAPDSSLISQDQLEIRHNAQQEELHLEEMTSRKNE